MSDRIVLWVAGPAEIEAAVQLHKDWIAEEVLARQVTVGGNIESHNAAQSADIYGQPVNIALERAV